MKSYDSLLDGDVELQKEIQELIQEKVAEREFKAMQQGIKYTCGINQKEPECLSK